MHSLTGYDAHWKSCHTTCRHHASGQGCRPAKQGWCSYERGAAWICL